MLTYQPNAALLTAAVWKKASRSNGTFVDQGVAVRDSKDRTGPALMFTPAEWDAFIGSAKDGEFDRP
jgi:hypothetical protein